MQDPDGGEERFRKYLPFKSSLLNTDENYPYPYVINRLCWEFPCIVPSDWEAQYVQKPYNPKTVEDMKAALDAVVLKQGVFNLVFHPHGWIKSEQVVELIDHAVAKHGKKVKFLNFREAQERLDKNLLAGQPLQSDRKGQDNGVRVLDVDNDGFMDVVHWQREQSMPRDAGLGRLDKSNGKSSETPVVPVNLQRTTSSRRSAIDGRGHVALWRSLRILRGDGSCQAWAFDDDATWPATGISTRFAWIGVPYLSLPGRYSGDRCIGLRDIDHDGRCEPIDSSAKWWRAG